MSMVLSTGATTAASTAPTSMEKTAMLFSWLAMTKTSSTGRTAGLQVKPTATMALEVLLGKTLKSMATQLASTTGISSRKSEAADC